MSPHPDLRHAHAHEEHPGHRHSLGRQHHERGPRSSSPTEERGKDRRRLLMALALSGSIAVAEAAGGWLTGSLALLSDAGHMVGDVSAIGLSLLAFWFSGRPADVRRTYGYYRLEILSALLNGVLLLGITGFILYEAWERLQSPRPIALGAMTLVAVVGLAANLASLSVLRHTHSLNVRSAFLHVLGDTFSSVGVLLGAGIMWLTGWLVVDAIISAVIAVIIVVGAVRLVRDAVDVLLEAVPAHVDMEALKAIMVRVEGVTAVHDLHVWTISSGLYALSAHLVVADPMVCNNDTILSAVKHELLERFGIDHTTIQIESESYAHAGKVH